MENMKENNLATSRDNKYTRLDDICQGLAYILAWPTKDGSLKWKGYSAYIMAIMALIWLKIVKGVDDVRVYNNRVDTFDPETYAREHGMVRKVKADGKVIEYVRLGKSDLQRWSQREGLVPYDVFCKVDINCSPYAEEADKAYAEQMAYSACNGKLLLDGVPFLPESQSASDRRKGCYLAVSKKYFDKVTRRTRGGANMAGKTCKVAKTLLVYPSLGQSSSDENQRQIDWDRIAIIPDAHAVIPERSTTHVNPNNSVEKRIQGQVVNLFDGFSCKVVNSKKGIKPSQDRFGFEHKGFSDVVTRHYLKEHYGNVLPTMFGDMDIDDVEYIMTESTAKWLGVFENPTQWSEACRKYGYKQCTCGIAHKSRLKGLPYQQGQLLRAGTDEEARQLAQEAWEALQVWKSPDKAAEIFDGAMRNVVEMYPAILKTRPFLKMWKERLRIMRNRIVCGEIPRATRQFYVAPDLKSFFGWTFYRELRCDFALDEAICKELQVGQPVVSTRNPATDGIPQCRIIEGDDELYNEGVFYVNPFSWISIWLRLDYDGDKVKIIVHPLLVEIARRTREQFGDDPVTFDQPAAKKEEATKASFIDAIIESMFGSQVGKWSDDLTRLLNISPENAEMLKTKFGASIIAELHAVLTKIVNVDIDSAKNAKETAKMDQRIAAALKLVHKLPLPLYCGRYKAINKRGGTRQEVAEKSAYTGSFIDKFVRYFCELCGFEQDILKMDETVFDETPDGFGDLIFDVSSLMIDPKRAMKGYHMLARKSDYDHENDRYYNQGLFNNLAFRHRKEWTLLGTLDGVEKADEKSAIREAALKEIEEFVKLQGGNLDGAYDIITRWFFKNTDGINDDAFDRLSDEYFTVFADKLCTTLAMNVAFGDVDIEEDCECEEQW